MTPRRTAVALTLALLSGCVPASMEKVEVEGETVVLSLPLPWQEAYRRLNAQMQQCLHAPSPLAATMAVDGQFYDELHVGEIVATYPTGPFSGGSGPVARVQMRPAESGARVTVLTSAVSIAKLLPDRVDAWLNGSTECK